MDTSVPGTGRPKRDTKERIVQKEREGKRKTGSSAHIPKTSVALARPYRTFPAPGNGIFTAGGIHRHIVRSPRDSRPALLNYQIPGRHISTDGIFRYPGHRPLSFSEGLGSLVLFCRSPHRFFHDPLGDLLQRGGLAADRCGSGNVPDMRMVYLGGTDQEQFRVNTSHLFCNPDENQ